MNSSEQQERILGKQIKDMEDWAIDCLKKPGTGCREGEEKRRITLRVFRFSIGRPCHGFAEIEEHKVY